MDILTNKAATRDQVVYYYTKILELTGDVVKHGSRSLQLSCRPRKIERIGEVKFRRRGGNWEIVVSVLDSWSSPP
jgi:hypothetical protein